MASLAIVLIILGCVAHQYLKATLIKSFAMVIITICASIVAFGYFELLANVFISRSHNSRNSFLVLWAQPLSFVLLFILAFAVLQTIAAQLTRKPIDLGIWPERIGRVVCGIFLGLILSGLLLTALAMAPIPAKYPYQRFDQARPDAEKPNKALFNADGFATGAFSIVSSGSFSGKRSFAALHPAFLDQAFLNRHNITDNISVVTGSQAIKTLSKKNAWPAPEGLKDSNGKALSPKSGYNLTIVRVAITTELIRYTGTFTFSQLRLICKQKNDAEKPFAGKAKNIYPIGYLRAANQLQIKRLNDQIKLEHLDFSGGIREIDFAFYVPNDFVPVVVEFKQNSIAKVALLGPADQVPPAVPFIQLSKCATNTAELEPISSAKVYGVELATGAKFLAELTLEISDPNQWENAQTARSILPAQFDDGKINHVRAELKIEEPAQEQVKGRRGRSREKTQGIPKMLKPLNGYKLLSLKCNNPPTGVAIKGEQLPVLVELSGLIHHAIGIIASGKVGDQVIHEADYCSLTADEIPGGLAIAEDGSVIEPFPDAVWLTEQAQSISEFYALYLVRPGRNVIITSVQPADSQTAAGFKGYEGFLVN